MDELCNKSCGTSLDHELWNKIEKHSKENNLPVFLVVLIVVVVVWAVDVVGVVEADYLVGVLVVSKLQLALQRPHWLE